MEIHIRLYGALRDNLPAADRGRATLDIAPGSTVADLIEHLQLKRYLQTAVNGIIIDDLQTPLQNGDKVESFRPAAGG